MADPVSCRSRPDYFSRYNAQLPKAREWVAAVGEKDPIRSVIDVERLGKLLQPVEPGVRSKVARDTVPATIYAICFLRSSRNTAPEAERILFRLSRSLADARPEFIDGRCAPGLPTECLFLSPKP